MKKQFYLPLVTLFLLFSFAATATNYTVTVNGNYPNYTFTPSAFNVNVGDSITWQQDFQTHPLESTEIPEGAAPFYYGGYGSTFTYAVTIPGHYSFKSGTYQFSGQFMAEGATGVQRNNTEPAVISIYPNVSSDVVNVSVRDAFNKDRQLSVEVYDILGNEVMNFDFISANPTQVNVRNLANGLYIVSVRENSNVMAVQKIVKD